MPHGSALRRRYARSWLGDLFGGGYWAAVEDGIVRATGRSKRRVAVVARENGAKSPKLHRVTFSQHDRIVTLADPVYWHAIRDGGTSTVEEEASTLYRDRDAVEQEAPDPQDAMG